MNTTWWSYFVILLGSILALLYKYSTRNYDYWKKRNIRFIKPYPFFGSILPLFAMKKTIGEWLRDFCYKIKEDYFGIFIFNRPVLIVKSPKLIRAILQKDFTYFDDRFAISADMKHPITREFLFFKKNPGWNSARSKLRTIFTSGKLKAMFPLVLEESTQMVDYLRKFANVPNFEAKEVAAKYSTNVIAKCAFAIDAGSFRDENAEFRKLTRQMFGFSFDTAVRHFGSFFAPEVTGLFRMEVFHPKVIKACKRIFLEVLKLKKQSENFYRNDLVDLMLETNKKHEQYFTDDAMIGHAIQFVGAGFETAAATISFALYELALHPEVQEMLRNEILDTIEKNNGLSYAAIFDMKYLDMVICEILRKYPALPFLDRTCKTDYKVEGTDLIIEKGTSILIPIFGLSYNPKFFPDPYKFDPERFTDKSKINNDGIYYLPFGEGPRICIGERLGLMEVKIGLAQIVSKFRVERSPKTPDRIEFEPKSVVLQSTVGIPLTFVPL